MPANASAPIRRLISEAELRGCVSAWRQAGETIALVPTMGALHEGHLRLIDLAHTRADRVVASIFVNPVQFGPQEDFARYPRQENDDVALLASRGADAVWLPEITDIYPTGFSTMISVGELGSILCGASRPGHFDGVATVVAILLGAVRPDVSVFGEKDFQQLSILRRVHADLRLPGAIVGAPIVREADGLAMSSRNRYLSEHERRLAPLLHRCLEETARRLCSGQPADILHEALLSLEANGFRPDYLEWRDGATLAPITVFRPGSRLFVAASLGRARLIDNLAMD